MPLLYFLLSPAERRDCPFQRLQSAPCDAAHHQAEHRFRHPPRRYTPYRGTKRGQSSAGGEGQGPEFAIAVCLADCSAARVTQPSPVGPDTFTLSSRTFHGRTDTARDAAVSAANQHCTRLSKKLLLLRSSTNTNFRANETVTNSDADEAVVDVTFRCLAAGDSELRKPSGSPQQ